jgi:hypothetical protein
MSKQIPQRLSNILEEIGLTTRQATWDCHGTPVVLHKALEKIAAHYQIKFDAPTIIESDASSKTVVVCVTGRMGDVSEWSFGEAAPYNNKNNYPFAMAEKRAKDRVILKLVGLHGDTYSQAEADEFEEGLPSLNMTTDDRFEASLTFYEGLSKTDKDLFLAGEKSYKRLINTPDLTEEQFDKVIKAHNEAKELIFT